VSEYARWGFSRIVRTGNTSGDDNNVGAGEGLLETVILGEVPLHSLSYSASLHATVYRAAYGGRRDVGEIGSDTEYVDDIVESELRDGLVCLEEEGQWLITG
jgi:hypothetical protein